MQSDSKEKLVIALFSVLVGWILAQGATLLKEWWDRRRLKLAVDQEIDLIRDQLKGIVPTYLRLIALDAHGALEPTTPRKLQNFIFTDQYAKAAPSFTHTQRLQLQAIHGYVEEINSNIESLKTMSLDLARKHLSNQITSLEMQQYRQMLEQHIHVLMDAGWQVLFYIQNRANPEIIQGGSAHESRVRSLVEIDKLITDQRAEALKRPLEDVLATYRPGDFAWPHHRP